MKVELVDYMGSDLSIINAAKASFDKKDDRWINDEEAKRLGIKSHPRLIKYLAKHNHWTPFAHTAISLRMGAPVPVRTHCFKHKQGFVENEESRRYISSTPELFVPDEFRKAPVGSIKQGSADTHPQSSSWKKLYSDRCMDMIKLYENMIDDKVCPEQARFVLPQGCEVTWIWTGNLYSFANFYKKRTDPNAQKEVQNLALVVGSIIEPLFPVSWKALVHG